MGAPFDEHFSPFRRPEGEFYPVEVFHEGDDVSPGNAEEIPDIRGRQYGVLLEESLQGASEPLQVFGVQIVVRRDPNQATGPGKGIEGLLKFLPVHPVDAYFL